MTSSETQGSAPNPKREMVAPRDSISGTSCRNFKIVTSDLLSISWFDQPKSAVKGMVCLVLLDFRDQFFTFPYGSWRRLYQKSVYIFHQFPFSSSPSSTAINQRNNTIIYKNTNNKHNSFSPPSSHTTQHHNTSTLSTKTNTNSKNGCRHVLCTFPRLLEILIDTTLKRDWTNSHLDQVRLPCHRKYSHCHR